MCFRKQHFTLFTIFLFFIPDQTANTLSFVSCTTLPQTSDLTLVANLSNLLMFLFRYRQILEKAVQFTDADQLESLKAFVEASMLHSFTSSTIHHHLSIVLSTSYRHISNYFHFSQWLMKTSVLSSRGNFSLISAHICRTFPTPRPKQCITSPWKRFSRGSFHSRSR